MANEQNREHWNRSGESWVAFQRTFDCMLEPIGARLLDHAALTGGQRVLDVGCGYGTTTLAIAKLGAQVHGVDISTPMVEAARASLRGRVANGAVRLHASIWLVSATCQQR